MKFEGALIKEQGVEFAIIIVKNHVINSALETEKSTLYFSKIFRSVPIVLMSQNSKGIPTYKGRQDIVKFMSRVPLNSVPWKIYTV